MTDFSKEWKNALSDKKGINLDMVDATIASARGIIPEHLIDKLRGFRNDSEFLYLRDQLGESMWAGQAMFELSNAMHNDIQEKREILAGRKVITVNRKTNAAISTDAKKIHAEWQKRANEKWRQPQHKNKSVNAIAKLIARGNENADTIRRKIKKLA